VDKKLNAFNNIIIWLPAQMQQSGRRMQQTLQPPPPEREILIGGSLHPREGASARAAGGEGLYKS
jgi:hypothetical protein